METLTIKIKDSNALKLIHDLEAMNILEVVSPEKKKSGVKLSERLSGSISAEQAEIMHKELQQMRSEWERDIY
jgi:hypothetical protein